MSDIQDRNHFGRSGDPQRNGMWGHRVGHTQRHIPNI